MTIDEFLDRIDDKQPPAPLNQVIEFEKEIGATLPPDYRDFLCRCNGGYVGGNLWFKGPTPGGEPADAGVHHVGGFQEESYFSLRWSRNCYQAEALRVPLDLIWIMDDPFGNAICLGLHGPWRGRIFFWDHELEPDPDTWDGRVETAGNIQLIAGSFKDFVAGLARNE